MSKLGDYLRKRSFSKTPEPKSGKIPKHSKLRFVVQEHDATRLHYDFRLEMEGVLKSWAVPKGPSMNPHDHHLAVRTEDHPYEYRTFEGVIPEGNYGAGNVIIWDEGWYEARKGDAKDSEKTVLKELDEGHITFILHGEKLQGEFALIKMHDDEKSWLLVKKSDEFASESDVTQQTESVKSHHVVTDLGAPHDIANYPKKAPWQVKPMLSTLVDEPFDRDGWLFEIKWDGYRAIGNKHGTVVDLYSRNHLDFTAKYSPVAAALRELQHDAIVDGEIVVVDDEGVAHFEWLQNWHRHPRGTLRYQIFDLISYNGRDIRAMPLTQRRALLRNLLPPDHEILRFSDAVEANGRALFGEMQRRGLEGMIAKRGDSPYRENTRGMDWLKVKTHLRQEVVIGGFTEPKGSRKYIGSLLVGVYQDGEFVYVGHSGGGIPDAQRKELHERLQKLKRKSSPFITTPKPNAPVHWVAPKIVCEMSFGEWTSDGMMRQPTFEGLRSDKSPSAVHREKIKHVDLSQTKELSMTRLPFEPTHLDKVFFPKPHYTKGDLFAYYQAVAKYVLPYIKDRPLSLNRMPSGIDGESFFQKNHEHLPDWVPHADIFSDSNNADLRWIVGGKLETLLYCVQLGAIEVNPWNSRTKHLDKPDWIVIDLDPEGIGFDRVVEVAQTVKKVCDEWDIPTYPKTSGKTGLHIYIPMHAKYDYDQAKNLAHLIVLEVNKRQPDITSVVRDPDKRRGKIYLDYLQNREGQTLAAPYSVRPTQTATVSAPLKWSEVKQGLKPTDFTIKTMPVRLKKLGDLWQPTLGAGVNLAAVIKTIEQRTS